MFSCSFPNSAAASVKPAPCTPAPTAELTLGHFCSKDAAMFSDNVHIQIRLAYAEKVARFLFYFFYSLECPAQSLDLKSSENLWNEPQPPP